MEVDVLEKAQSVYAKLTEVQRQQKIFTQYSPDFAAKHWSYPWCMFTDDEWNELTAKIKGRFKERIAELEKEFAAL